MMQRITGKDVTALISDPSGAARAITAQRIAEGYREDVLTPEERKLAEEIFRLMVRDAEVRVRQALADNLKENPHIPRDIAVKLAGDVDSVAIPMLAFSDALADEDLIAVVRSRPSQSRHMAVAGRRSVSKPVSHALIEVGSEPVVTRLLSNHGAVIADASLAKAVDRFGDREPVQTALIGRPRLPITLAERLVALVSQSLRVELARRHDLPGNLLSDIILQGRERATIGLATGSDDDELQKLVRQLEASGRLTPSLVMRALCTGDMRFFETAMAVRAGIPLPNARALIYDAGPLGLRALYKRARLPLTQLIAVRAAIHVSRETAYDGRERDRERHARRMIERILTQHGESGIAIESSDLEYLLAKLEQLPPESLDGAP